MRIDKFCSVYLFFPAVALSLMLSVAPMAAYADSSHAEGSQSRKYSAPHGSLKGHTSGGYTHESPHGKKEGSGSKSYAHGKSYRSYKGYGKHSGHYKSGHDGFAHHGSNPFEHVKAYADKLGLTEAQRDQIRTLEFEYKKKKIELDAAHKIAHMELDQLVHSGTVDESKMREIGNRIADIKTKSIQSMIESKIALLKLLTDEQRKMIKTMHAGH